MLKRRKRRAPAFATASAGKPERGLQSASLLAITGTEISFENCSNPLIDFTRNSGDYVWSI
jgi:hypothetical protein